MTLVTIGFTKRDDLRYFLREICGIEYLHRPELAPTEDLFDAYKKKRIDWDRFSRDFLVLAGERRFETIVPRKSLEGACLLCSEARPERCHRRLIAEYLRGKWADLDVRDL